MPPATFHPPRRGADASLDARHAGDLCRRSFLAACSRARLRDVIRFLINPDVASTIDIRYTFSKQVNSGLDAMSHQNFSPPRSTEVIPGVFLCRASIAYDQLKVSDFASEQLFLPPNLERAVHKRQIEYLLGRLCIKQCFKGFGVEPMIVVMGEDRSPVWPKAWVGSISHSRGQVVAVLSRAESHVGLGIDLEAVIENPSTALQTQICCDPTEIQDLELALQLTEQEALTLIFSAKESLYKLIFPRYRRFFGFQAARVRPSEGKGLEVSLVQPLNEEFHERRSWPVQWQKLDAFTLETFITEPAIG